MIILFVRDEDQNTKIMIDTNDGNINVHHSFTYHLSGFQEVLSRVEKLMGSMAGKDIKIKIDLRWKRICFSSDNKNVQLGIKEFLAVPEDDLTVFTSTDYIEKYEEIMFPKGESLTLDETLLRFAWLRQAPSSTLPETSSSEDDDNEDSGFIGLNLFLSGTIEWVSIFTIKVRSKQDLPKIILFIRKYRLDDAPISYTVDKNGGYTSMMSPKSELGSEMTTFGLDQYVGGEENPSPDTWDELLRGTQFLVLENPLSVHNVLFIYQFNFD